MKNFTFFITFLLAELHSTATSTKLIEDFKSIWQHWVIDYKIFPSDIAFEAKEHKC